MTGTRDSQRSKVYAAERASGLTPARGTLGTMTIDECYDYTRRVLDSAYVRRRWPHATTTARLIQVVPGRNGGHAGRRWGTPFISLGRWARTEYIVLHEIAHHLAGLDRQHDWQFCDTLLNLVRHFLGRDAHDALRDQFKAHKVRYRAPVKRPVSDERRAELAARMKALNAARAASAAEPVSVD
jgi:putative metallohydrolase (TIGR04338 family)